MLPCCNSVNQFYTVRRAIVVTEMITKLEGGAAVVRRNLPGTRADLYSKWAEEPFEEMDSTLAVQQYIQQTIRRDPQG